MVRQTVVAEVAIVVVVECLRAERRPEVVELNDYETEFREREGLTAALELPCADAADLRPRVDMVDDRIFFRRVELGREIDHTIEIGDAVARLHGEHLGGLPPGGLESRCVRLLELAHDTAVGHSAEHGHRRLFNPRIAVDEVLPVRREVDVMMTVLGRDQREARSVVADTI